MLPPGGGGCPVSAALGLVGWINMIRKKMLMYIEENLSLFLAKYFCKIFDCTLQKTFSLRIRYAIVVPSCVACIAWRHLGITSLSSVSLSVHQSVTL